MTTRLSKLLCAAVLLANSTMADLHGGTGDWEMFNLKDDPAEMHDLSAKHPDKRAAMIGLWDEYVKRNSVILTGDGPCARKE